MSTARFQRSKVVPPLGFSHLPTRLFFHTLQTAKRSCRLSSSPALLFKTYFSAACTTALPHYSQVVTMYWYSGARDVITCYFLD